MNLGVEFDSRGAFTVRPKGSIWSEALLVLEEKIEKSLFAAWIKPLRVTTAVNNQDIQITIACRNTFTKEYIKNEYGSLITAAVNDVLHDSNLVPSIIYTVGASSAQTEITDSKSKLSSPALTTEGLKETQKETRHLTDNTSTLNPRYNFSNYVVGPCNQFAHAVSLRISENPGTFYNPLFIYGGVGLGKTHLATAIGNAAKRRGKKVLFVSSELFVNELITALRTNRMQQFKERYRSLDLLIIDDIQFLVGKECTQEEFFHTFNVLHSKRAQIILTSDKIPQQLTGLEERLRTRFASGISADLQSPSFETRLAILEKKAELENIILPREVSELLAKRITSNIRELEGALNRVLAFTSLSNLPLNLDTATSCLDSFAPEETGPVTIELVQRGVSDFYGTTVKDLLGKRRTKNIAQPRQVAMFLCRKLTPASYPEIGVLFGGRDHSTVIHAIQVVEERIKTDSKFSSELRSVEDKLRCGKNLFQ
ncbi:chromosomal replication initiator protein DnaA [bacterium]|nr:chromosomal replication initiator protein DnaA [bacterium]